MDRKKIQDTLDIIEYVVNVRRRIYSSGHQSYIIWGCYSALSGLIHLVTGFWPIWFIMFIVAGFVETVRHTGIRESLIGWGFALLSMALGVIFSIKTGLVWLSALGFGIAATLGFTLPFKMSARKNESGGSYLGRVIGLLWITLVISTLVAISVTVSLASIKSVYMWMTMVGTGYVIMGVMFNDVGPVVAGGLALLSVIVVNVIAWNPIVLTIIVGVISIGVGVYERSRV